MNKDYEKHVFSRPDFSPYDMSTYEGKLQAFQMLLGSRDEEGYAVTGDITSLDPELLEYTIEDGVEIVVARFRPKEWMLNGLRYVQGGYLASMIDVICGPMSDICSNGHTAGTLDMTTTYFRPITMDDEEIIVRVRLTSNTKRVMHFEAELLNSKGKRAVSAISNIMKATQAAK